MTGRSPKKPVEKKQKPSPEEKEKKHKNELLDESLEETFPASDPLAMLEPAPNSKRSKDKNK
jgi:hypothetical protein